MGDLLDLALEAAGGLERWNGASEAVVPLDSGGRAFDLKLKRSALRNIEGTVSTGEPRTVYRPYRAAGQRGIFERDRVRIETDAGELVAERIDPRSAFRGRASLRRNLWWDHLDLLYFAGYALWNYIAAPFLFTHPGFELTEGEPLDENGETWRRLDVRFPPDVPTHSPEQSFYYDPQGRLRRHDYTAEPFGSFARAVHLCDEHRTFDGLVAPTRRRVHPRLPSGRPFRPLTLVWIDIERIELR